MSFTPLMTGVVAGLRPLLPEQATIIEFGNQTFNADNAALAFALSRRNDAFVTAELEALRALPPGDRGGATERYVRALGFGDYRAIDINDRYNSLIMDLNEPLVERYGFTDQFDLVTNNGTGEHIFDQNKVYLNAHDLTRPGGLMLHIMPFVEYVNHGFYSFHPNLYYALAGANHYELLALGVATRNGAGFLAAPAGDDSVPQLFMQERRVPLSVLLSDSKPHRGGIAGMLYGGLRALLTANKPGRRFNSAIRRLQRSRPKLLMMALMRRTSPDAFRKPVQLRYEEDFGDAELERAYRG